MPGASPTDDNRVDLLLYRIVGDPGLAGVGIATAPAAVGDPTRLTAGGRTQGDLTFYDVAGLNSSSPDWTKVSETEPNNVRLYETNGSREVRWGDNRVSSLADGSGSGDDNLDRTDVFLTRFDEAVPRGDTVSRPTGDAVAFEAQAVKNDSGGAGFAVDPITGDWELNGLILAVSTFANQPETINSAAFSGGEGNLTDGPGGSRGVPRTDHRDHPRARRRRGGPRGDRAAATPPHRGSLRLGRERGHRSDGEPRLSAPAPSSSAATHGPSVDRGPGSSVHWKPRPGSGMSDTHSRRSRTWPRPRSAERPKRAAGTRSEGAGQTTPRTGIDSPLFRVRSAARSDAAPDAAGGRRMNPA